MKLADDRRLAILAVAVLGLLAGLQHWLANRRPSPSSRAIRELTVTNSRDQGPGSLREAIFAADTAPGPARIVLQLTRIALHSPLPPLVNPHGIEMDSGGLDTQIDAHELGGGAVFDVDSPNSIIQGVTIRNAPEQAILVRKDSFRLIKTQIVSCDQGLDMVEGVRNLLIDQSSFENNRIGIRLGSGGSGIFVRNSRFISHKDAGVWAVEGGPLSIEQGSGFVVRSNYFDGDRISIVLGNMPLLAEGNEFVKAREAAIFVIGEKAVIRANRIRDGAGIGVIAQSTEGMVIEDNELDHNQAIGVLVRSSQHAFVDRNRVYDNGYGIALVLGKRQNPSIAAENIVFRQRYDGIVVIGDSPVIRRNRALNNSAAGLRVLDFIPETGIKIGSEPFLEKNTLDGNRLNAVTYGEYRVRESQRTR